MHQSAVDAARPRFGPPAAHRGDVDGLRALAVLAILAFHLDLAGFTGGFVGVDVFFVISGYVILRSILPDLESGRFSIAGFFIRRIRRLVPALLVVLAATLAAGFALLSPSELEELAGSALATLGYGANIFFFDRTGYFAREAHARPLLHMWSLGIEEQFYIIVPAALAALVRFRGTTVAVALAVLAVGSFAYSAIATASVSESHAFYMPMARFWEIAVGGCVAVVERRWGLVRSGAGWVAAFGLLAIAASVLILESDAGGQQWAVVAVLGSAAVIAAAPGRTWAAATLASWPMAAIGRISYSIYLVHWPLIVFGRLYLARPLHLHEQALLAALTAAAAVALAILVERPMRAGSGRIGNRAALTSLCTASAVLAAASIAVVLDRGAPWRLQTPAREALVLLDVATTGRPQCHKDAQWLGTTHRSVCRWNREAVGTDFVIWGDSHAGHIAAELSGVLIGAGYRSGVSVVLKDCMPIAGVTFVGHKFARTKACPDHVDAVLEAITRERARIVVMAARWANVASDVRAPGDGWWSGHLRDLANGGSPLALADALLRTIERIRASGAQVIVIGPVPEADYNVPAALVRSLHGFGYLPPVRRTDFDRRQDQVLSALAKLHGLDGVSVVYPHVALCDEQTCAVADGIRSLYIDDDHLSPFGAVRVAALTGSMLGFTVTARAGLKAAFRQ
jgi:peptidoglycan/LPS O-acetylase OafA/YrhL